MDIKLLLDGIGSKSRKVFFWSSNQKKLYISYFIIIIVSTYSSERNKKWEKNLLSTFINSTSY